MKRLACIAPWLVLVALSGCGLTTHARPVPERTTQFEAAIGGPVVDAWRAPLPDATVGVRYGLLPRWDAGVHVEVPLLFAGLFRLDAETNVLAIEQHESMPAFSFNARGYALAGGGGGGLAGDLGATLSWLLDPNWMLFAGVAGHLSTFDMSTCLVAGGTRVQLGPIGVQAEFRWYGLETVHLGDNKRITWVGPFGNGAFGMVFGVDVRSSEAVADGAVKNVRSPATGR